MFLRQNELVSTQGQSQGLAGRRQVDLLLGPVQTLHTRSARCHTMYTKQAASRTKGAVIKTAAAQNT